MTTPLAAHLDRLVADARASRDATFNSLDAVNRQTAAANAEIRQRAQQFITEHARPEASIESREERDARFDPEDVWDLPPREPAASHSPADDTADEEDYPETWLR